MITLLEKGQTFLDLVNPVLTTTLYTFNSQVYKKKTISHAMGRPACI